MTLYDADYARRYRAHDDELDDSGPYLGFAAWLGRVCRMFQRPIDALDLGCGTGRYFSALEGVRNLVGIDASAPMLDHARDPYKAEDIRIGSITLVEGDLATHDFGDRQFDLVYSIGVLAEHVPLDEKIVARVASLVNAGGRFAFTTVHPESPSVYRTVRRRLGGAVQPFLRGALKRRIRERLMGHGAYADETRIRELMAPAFIIESLERFVSEAHLHCLCVARRTA